MYTTDSKKNCSSATKYSFCNEFARSLQWKMVLEQDRNVSDSDRSVANVELCCAVLVMYQSAVHTFKRSLVSSGMLTVLMTFQMILYAC